MTPDDEEHLQNWRRFAEQLARTLVATIPGFTDQGYGETAARFLDRRPPPVDEDRPEGTWLRVGLGYAYIGPRGKRHFYTRTRPADVPDSEILTIKLAPPGRLLGAVRAAAADARHLLLSEPVRPVGNSPDPLFTCPPALRQQVGQFGRRLEGCIAATMPSYNASVLRQHQATAIEALGKTSPLQVLKDSLAEIADRRAGYAADGWLCAIGFTRCMLAELLPQGTPDADRLMRLSMDGSDSSFEPERMLHSLVLRYANAGLAGLVLQATETALDQSRAAKDEALAAAGAERHAEALYRAATFGFTAWLLADLMLNHVPRATWPDGFAEEKVTGLRNRAEELVVRTCAALQVGCINADGAALGDHRAEIQARGPGWATELIEGFYYYPQAAKGTLLGAA